MAVKLVTFCSYHTGMRKVTSGAVKISLIALIVWLIFFHALIVVLTHILFVTFFYLFHLQVDVVSPLLLNASLLLVLTTDYSHWTYWKLTMTESLQFWRLCDWIILNRLTKLIFLIFFDKWHQVFKKIKEINCPFVMFSSKFLMALILLIAIIL